MANAPATIGGGSFLIAGGTATGKRLCEDGTWVDDNTVGRVTITDPATSATLTIADGKTLTATNTLELAGTDGTKMTFPGASATIPGVGVANTWTAHQTITDKDIVLGTTTGTKLGTATAQKLGFWGATPVVQQVFATGAGHTVDELITVLQTLGLVKQS